MHKKWVIFFLIYSVSVFFIFIYILFPSQMIKRKMEQTISRHFTGQVNIREVSFALPVQFRLKGVDLTLSDIPEGEMPASIKIDEMKAGLNFLKILRGRIGIRGEIQVGDGSIKANFDQRLIGKSLRHLSGVIKNIAIQDFPFLGQQLGIHVTGLLNGELDANWSGQDIIQSDGTWSFHIDKGRITPRQFPAFSYDSVQGRGIIKEQNIQITRIEVEGQDLSLVATGQVRLASQIKKFHIDTQVGLKLLPNLRQRLGAFASLLPKPDNSGFINLFVSGPPGGLRFSSKRIRKSNFSGKLIQIVLASL